LKEESMAMYAALIRGIVTTWAIGTGAFVESAASADELQITTIRGVPGP
jgi:hypothetical protein